MDKKRGLTFPAYPNGQYAGSNGPVVASNPGVQSNLDKSRFGSADNTSKNYANEKKVVRGMK